jgi:cytidylate kinase
MIMDSKSSSQRLGEAVERARHHWSSRYREEKQEALPKAVPPAFIVAVSREAGAQGSAVARAVGERLGWVVYDRELLQHIAEEMGIREELLTSVDEKQRGWLQECVQAIAAVPTVSASAYVRRLVDLLLSLASHGRCVIVGRGAAQILPAETTLRVRLLAPFKDRVRCVQQKQGIDAQRAMNWTEQTDAERSRFVKDHFQKDPTDPRLYDLVLNSSRFSVGECADLIVEALYRLQSRAANRTP